MVITLCGSVRFEDDFKKAGLELGRRGIACFTLAVMPPLPANFNPRGQELEENGLDKIMLDLGYFEKIMRSDAVLVLGDGYVGKSTAREILWADQLGKPVILQFCYSYPKSERKTWEQVALNLKNLKHERHATILAKRVFGYDEQ